ncbi:MAG TPA: hypothetical protein VGG34_01405 [Opitutaceae bacterium]|jgi:hypothetical protein
MKSTPRTSLTFPVLVVIAAIVACFGLSACTNTVHQAPVPSTQPSFDGDVQDSGIVADLPDGSYVVTASFLARYNRLIATYGNAKTADGSPIFTPALAANAGVEPLNPATILTLYQGRGAYIMTAEAMDNMVVLSRLKKRGFKP